MFSPLHICLSRNIPLLTITVLAFSFILLLIIPVQVTSLLGDGVENCRNWPHHLPSLHSSPWTPPLQERIGVLGIPRSDSLLQETISSNMTVCVKISFWILFTLVFVWWFLTYLNAISGCLDSKADVYDMHVSYYTTHLMTIHNSCGTKYYVLLQLSICT